MHHAQASVESCQGKDSHLCSRHHQSSCHQPHQARPNAHRHPNQTAGRQIPVHQLLFLLPVCEAASRHDTAEVQSDEQTGCLRLLNRLFTTPKLPVYDS